MSRTAASMLHEALENVGVDYSKHKRFTQGIVKTNLERFDFGTKARLVGRALWWRLSG